MNMHPYLTFDGRCREAFAFYQMALGGKIVVMITGADTPMADQMPAEHKTRIMHGRIEIAGQVIMASDAPVDRYRAPQGFNLQVGFDKPADAEAAFKRLSEGGTITMPLQETFWAHKFGTVTDRFGIPWMINCERATYLSEMTGPMQCSAPFIIERTFDAPVSKVYAAFTDPALMKQWWGPKGVTILVSNMDLRPGGRYHYGMRMPTGQEMWGRMIYQDIVPHERLVFLNAFSDAAGGITRHPMAPDWPLELRSTFRFEEKDGRTTVSIEWTPHNPSPAEQAAFDAGHASMKNGWTGTLDQLESFLAKT